MPTVDADDELANPVAVHAGEVDAASARSSSAFDCAIAAASVRPRDQTRSRVMNSDPPASISVPIDSMTTATRTSTKLKVMGVELAVMGEKESSLESDELVHYSEPSANPQVIG